MTFFELLLRLNELKKKIDDEAEVHLQITGPDGLSKFVGVDEVWGDPEENMIVIDQEVK